MCLSSHWIGNHVLWVLNWMGLVAPFLATPPSFMVSGVFPALYVLMQALVETLPTVPEMRLNTELPLSAFDGISRAYLLCNLVTPVVLTNPRPEVAASPWALLVASLVRAFILTRPLFLYSYRPFLLY